MALFCCKKTVALCEIQTALEILVKRHPMLRMTIKEDNNGPYFIEKKHVPINIGLFDTNWYAVSQNQYAEHFGDELHLWRFNLIQNDRYNEDNLLQFVFSMHHSIVDFPYSFVIILDFLTILKAIQNEMHNTNYKEYLFPVSVERIKGLEYSDEAFEESDYDVSSGRLSPVVTALEAYEYFFMDEINLLSTRVNTIAATQWQVIDNNITQIFFSKCKAEKVSKNAAILAALVTSFVNLLKSKGCTDDVKVQFSFWTNLRRYMDNDDRYYAGVAVVPCPVSVIVNTKQSPQIVYWDIARNIRDQTTAVINNRKPIQVLHKDIPSWVKDGRRKGKSINVFTLSNVDKVVVRPDIEENFRLLDVQCISDVKIDYSPIFLVLTSVLNFNLNISVHYSSQFTSEETAHKFTSNIKTIIENCID
ncbi:unnamed protein product [Mytilus coruscus]|uniref:Condensation domain-containing protein n=1 Tax=Mytilus coruscus TaxID=42192 RepID=A0A6J8E169_MYTCO|nr:unnamed protein product [Mytilus coruscus]